MSAVILGNGCVLGPLSRYQSFSASVRFPRSARSRKIPLHDGHLCTVTSPTVRSPMTTWHFGQLISSMLRRYR